MATSANRIYSVFRAKKVDNSSKIIGFTVISLAPMKLTDGDKLTLPVDFFVFNNSIDKTKISVGDKFLAISVNDSQIYYIQDVMYSSNKLYKYEKSINDLETEINSLKQRVTSLEGRVTALENRYN